MHSLRDAVIVELKSNSPLGALHVLQVFPELAKDSEVQTHILPWLSSPAGGFRRYSAQVLHEAGAPEGIRHITYNSLHYHPLLKVDNLLGSAWSNIATRFSGALTDECIDLLIDDMSRDRPFYKMNDNPFFHGFTLGISSNPKIVPQMLSQMELDGAQALYAAFVLSLHGNDHGRCHLEQAALDGTNPFIALVGLACLPKEKNTLQLFRPYAEGTHDVFRTWRKCFHRDIREEAERLIYLLSCDEMPLYSLLRNFFSKPLGETALFKHFNIANQCRPELRAKLDTPVFFGSPDYMAIWGRWHEQDIQKCLEEQKKALEIFFEIFDTASLKAVLQIRSGAPHHTSGDQYIDLILKSKPQEPLWHVYDRHIDQWFIKGFRVELEYEDYYHAGIDWFKRHERYIWNFIPFYFTYFPLNLS